MYFVGNRGQEVSSTNYWESEAASEGAVLLSWNAGAARILVPKVLEKDLPDMVAANYVVITFGKWREQHDRDAFELLFEDHSDAPYCLMLVAEQSDRRLPKSEAGIRLPFLILTESGCQARLDAYYRVARVPCLKPIDVGKYDGHR